MRFAQISMISAVVVLGIFVQPAKAGYRVQNCPMGEENFTAFGDLVHQTDNVGDRVKDSFRAPAAGKFVVVAAGWANPSEAAPKGSPTDPNRLFLAIEIEVHKGGRLIASDSIVRGNSMPNESARFCVVATVVAPVKADDMLTIEIKRTTQNVERSATFWKVYYFKD